MQETVANMIVYMINTLMDNFNMLNGILCGDIETNFSNLYGMIDQVRNLILPICQTILGIIFFVEFIKIIIRMENLNVEMLISVLAKFGIAYSAMEWGPSVLNAIYATTAEWIQSLASSSAAPSALEDLRDSASEAVAGLSFMECIGYMILITIAIIITAFVGYSIMIMAWVRIIEIIVLMAMIPLPVAFSMLDGGQIIKQYLFSFAAVCLQGFLMVVVCGMYGNIVEDMVISQAQGGNLQADMMGVVMIAVMLGMLLKKTGAWSRQIFALLQ